MDRFEKVGYLKFDEFGYDSIEILRDKQTGVMYVYHKLDNSGGLTVLVDKDGKPLFSAAS